MKPAMLATITALAAVIVLAGMGPADAGTVSPGAGRAGIAASWGKAIKMPGPGGAGSNISAVSCPAAGSCVAGGGYILGHYDSGFLVSQRRGSWGKPFEVPGLRALNSGRGANVAVLSCAAPGDCAAAGTYTDRSRHSQGFVVSERHGSWGKAIEIPGLGALNVTGEALVESVSCGSLGNCVVAGQYQDAFDAGDAFVASERNGAWGKAIEVPGVKALTAGPMPGLSGSSMTEAVSCTAPGNCAATGLYQAGPHHNRLGGQQGFVVSERGGTWGKAIEVPGLGRLNSDGIAEVVTVSCASPGNCAAGGTYANRPGIQGFVVSERRGTWGRAIAVRGLEALNTTEAAEVSSVSCGSPGNCAAVGDYSFQGFVVTERNGTWGPARRIADLAPRNREAQVRVSTVSCVSAGNCAAGGDYFHQSADFQSDDFSFVVSERNGAWSKATPIPGLQALNTGQDSDLFSMSCAAAGHCAAGGIYADRSHHFHGFVVTGTLRP